MIAIAIISCVELPDVGVWLPELMDLNPFPNIKDEAVRQPTPQRLIAFV